MLFFILVLICSLVKTGDGVASDREKGKRTIVNHFGLIHIKGNKIVDQSGTPVALHGMSLFWSQWGSFTIQTASDGCEMIGNVPLSELSTVFNLINIMEMAS
jgi:hypothetical protein